MRYETDEMEIDLRELLFVLRRKIVAIVLTAVIFAGATFAYCQFVASPVYEATSRLYIKTQSTSITSLADIQMSTVLAKDYVELIQSRTLCQEVIDNLELNMTYGQLKGCLKVTNPEDTRILNISIQTTDPAASKAIANEFAKVAKKQIAEIMKTDEPSLWETAIKPKSPVKPAKFKSTVLGGMVGAFLAGLISVVMYLMDDAIRTPEDVERRLGLNTLASIPDDAGKAKKKKKRRRKKLPKVSKKKEKKEKIDG